MLLRFLPNNFNFFEIFEKQVDYAVDAASCFKQLVTSPTLDESAVRKIRDIEHMGDEAEHNIIAQLNKTFITPFDREDIHALAIRLDDIIDTINTIAGRLKIYKISGVNKNLVEFASVIEESVSTVARAVKGLRNMKNSKAISDYCVEIHRLENVGDTMRDTVLAGLFETEKDPIAIIKWKEIYQNAEEVLDICEGVAQVVQGILVKQA
jgi:predicted phosphate transport protein (TIGR00153 family)